jgi:hypothetical protein
MHKSLFISTLALSISTQADSFRDAITFLENAPQAITNVMDGAPEVYKFQSQFGAESSVAYTGQVFRQHLINDLKATMGSVPMGGYPGTVGEAKNMLMSYYNYSEETTLTGIGVIDGFTEFKAKAKSLSGMMMSIEEGFVYSDIQSPGKNLYKKMAGIDNPLRRGKLYGTNLATTPDEYINVLFDMFAENAVKGKAFTVPNGNLAPQTINGANLTENGMDLTQLAQKFLHGAVSYSQAARDYLSVDLGASKGLNADNENPKGGATYTAMEHHFDEAFGYFGGARDYKLYNDSELRSKVSFDTNGDGFISALSEYNTGLATNFGRMDLTAADQDVDFSGTAINAFLKGRHLITQKPAGYKDYVVAQGQVALGAWERTFAALTIHYINYTLWQYSIYGTDQYLFTNFAKFWGEMKGFAFAFQFNPNGTMTDTTFDEMHALMGDAPVLPHADAAKVSAYVADLYKARELIQNTYGFSDINVQNW